MENIACPSCGYANTADHAACPSCGNQMAEARLLHSIEELKKLNERLSKLKKPPTFSSFNGFGTTLLDYRPAGDGKYQATRWVIALFLPIFPLSTYLIEPQGQERSYGRETSSFNVLGQLPLSPARVLRTYLLAVIGLFPVIWGSLNSSLINSALGGLKAFLAMLLAVAWGIYFIFFRLKNDSKAYKTRSA